MASHDLSGGQSGETRQIDPLIGERGCRHVSVLFMVRGTAEHSRPGAPDRTHIGITGGFDAMRIFHLTALLIHPGGIAFQSKISFPERDSGKPGDHHPSPHLREQAHYRTSHGKAVNRDLRFCSAACRPFVCQVVPPLFRFRHRLEPGGSLSQEPPHVACQKQPFGNTPRESERGGKTEFILHQGSLTRCGESVDVMHGGKGTADHLVSKQMRPFKLSNPDG